MSLKQTPSNEIPEETKALAERILGKEDRLRVMREELGGLYKDKDFEDLYDRRGPEVIAAWRLATVVVMQYMEGLTDREAAHAVKTRIDWKYVLGLELGDVGFDYSVLSEFRRRLVDGGASERLLERVLEKFKAKGLLTGVKQQRTDATHVLDSVRSLSRLELVRETLVNALEGLAETVPDWLIKHIDRSWVERYVGRSDEWRLPDTKDEREALGWQIGQDGAYLLRCMYEDPYVACLRESQAVETLRRVWLQNYQQTQSEDDSGSIQVDWRHAGNLPKGAQMIISPYDVESRWSIKRQHAWEGYKVHLTETCLAGTLSVITNVQTTPATQGDVEVTPQIHQSLDAHGLKPDQHFVDSGYMSVGHIVAAQTLEIELLGPVYRDHTLQGRNYPDFALAKFGIDWDRQLAICPTGQSSLKWLVNPRDQHVEVRFDPTVCAQCPARSQCIPANAPARTLKLKTRPEFEALQAARAYQLTDAFKLKYKVRAGAEALISQTVRTFDIRHSRYIGLAKTHLQMVGSAVATNLTRLAAFLADQAKPRTRRRRSPFALAFT